LFITQFQKKRSNQVYLYFLNKIGNQFQLT
jgi:hypothetical protein